MNNKVIREPEYEALDSTIFWIKICCSIYNYVACGTAGGIRLRDGVTSLEGRVEICYNSVWGTVCENSWSTNDAIVACRQLGFSGTA